MFRKLLYGSLLGLGLAASATLASGHGPNVEFSLEDGVLTATVPAGWSISSELLLVDAAREPLAAVDGFVERVGLRSADRSFLIPDVEFRSFNDLATTYVAAEVVVEMFAGADNAIRPLASIDRAYFACSASECTLIDWSAYALATGYAQLITLADGTVIFNLPGKGQ